jgi:transcriptional regulator with XRE-family HTH domain
VDFAQKLEILLNRDGASRGKLARAVGVHTSTVTNWLGGKEPKIESLIRVAEFFGVPVAYLTGETDDPSDRSKTHWAELVYGQKEKPTLQAESERIPGYSDLSATNKAIVDSMIAQLLAAQLED